MGNHDLAAICIVSKLKVVHGQGQGLAGENFAGVTIEVQPSQAPKVLPLLDTQWTSRSGDRTVPPLCCCL